MSTTAQSQLFAEEVKKKSGPVECLGMTFESDEARREYFLERLREKLQDPEFRKTPGFPEGSDEDILRLSDPPYYTVCPNPFMEEFVRHYGRPYDPAEEYHREPFASDVSEGKNDPIYNVHSYHTKVPHKAIMRYIAHYTRPGDVIFDGFCGTGMTGVASAMCRNDDPSNGAFMRDRSNDRLAVLCDLSPIATFIASNILRPISRSDFLEAVDDLCGELEAEFGCLYQTDHTGWRVRDRKRVPHKEYLREGAPAGSIDFTLYSDVVTCSICAAEVTFYDLAVDDQKDRMRSELRCPQCSAVVSESGWERVFTTVLDPVLGRPVREARIEPVLINYSVGSTRFEKRPDAKDLQNEAAAKEMLTRGGGLPLVPLIPGKETQRNASIGITHLHHFFTPREHLFVAQLLQRINAMEDADIRLALLFSVTAMLPYASRMRRFRADRKGGGPLSGTLYVGSLITPPNVLKTFRRNAETVADSLSPPVDPDRRHVISTQSATDLRNIPDHSVDYIFTDPPFGHNFDYSELNFFWEGVLGVVTNQQPEAIVSASQSKGVDEYRTLMENAFREYYRILKPGRWLTVEFSNTQAAVWNSIQTALLRAGFVVANTTMLDKKQHSFKAVMTPTAAKQDLIISAYKPSENLECQLELGTDSEEVSWEFVREHLMQLPVVVSRNEHVETVPERQSSLLYERVVSFHVQRGRAVPISANEFIEGLAQRFIERDNMYFLPEQAAEYDRRRSAAGEIRQFVLFVTDEASAIQWVRQQLQAKPQTFQELQPSFLKELQAWSSYERTVELREILEQNFLLYDGVGPVPSQIHSYLSSNYKDLRGLEKDDTRLIAKAKDRWYVPDPNKQGDLEKLRERALLKEFEEYKASRKKLRVFRTEALRAGFKAAYDEQDYETIVEVAGKIPERVLQEDEKLLMYYDVASMRLE